MLRHSIVIALLVTACAPAGTHDEKTIPASELEPLRASLAHHKFETTDSDDHQDGVLDGGALTIADMATHHRRVIVINDPPKLPKPVAAAQTALYLLVTAAPRQRPRRIRPWTRPHRAALHLHPKRGPPSQL